MFFNKYKRIDPSLLATGGRYSPLFILSLHSSRRALNAPLNPNKRVKQWQKNTKGQNQMI